MPTKARASASPPTLSDEVRRAVVAEYSKTTGLPPAEVEAGFDGGLAFDSLLGVEMSVGLEDRLVVPIPEEKLQQARLYKSLRAYAIGIQECVNEQGKEGADE